MTRSRYVLALATLTGALLMPGSAGAHADQTQPPYGITVDANDRTSLLTAYVITVHNNQDVPQNVTVTQRFAERPAGASASEAGQVTAETISWGLELQPHQPRQVTSDVAFHGTHSSLSTVCLNDPATGRVLDCQSGQTPVAQAIRHDQGFGWRAWLPLTIAVAVLLIGAFIVHRTRRRWAPALRQFLGTHRNPVAITASFCLVVLVAVGMLAAVALGARSMVKPQTTTVGQIGWSGEQGRLTLGVPASSAHSEFTLYQWTCVEQDSKLCYATVGVRNTSAKAQQWLLRMQRLQHTADTWSEPDGAATLAANAGADLFTPLAAGERRVATIVFNSAKGSPLSRLELREGAFSRGVALDLK